MARSIRSQPQRLSPGLQSLGKRPPCGNPVQHRASPRKRHGPDCRSIQTPVFPAAATAPSGHRHRSGSLRHAGRCRLLPTATVDRPGHRNVYPAGRHPRIHPERGATGAVRAENPPARNPKIDNPLRFDRHPDQQRRKNHSQKRGCDVQPAGRSLRQADDADARRRNPRLDQRRITAGLPRRIRKAEARNIRRRRNLHGSGARCRTAFLGTHRQDGCLRFGNQILHILLRPRSHAGGRPALRLRQRSPCRTIRPRNSHRSRPTSHPRHLRIAGGPRSGSRKLHQLDSRIPALRQRPAVEHPRTPFPLLQLSDRVYARSRSADALGQTRTQRRSGRSAENLERNSPYQPANHRIREFPNRL